MQERDVSMNYIENMNDTPALYSNYEGPFLSVHNMGSFTSEFFEIQTPYMISYLSHTLKQDQNTLIELSPYGHRHVSFSEKEYPFINNRSLHQHDYFEVIFVLSGNVIQHVESKKYCYFPGEGCVLNRNIRHREEFSTDFEAVFLLLTDDFLKSLIEHDIHYSAADTCHSYFEAICHLIQQNHRSKYYEAKECINFTPLHPVESNDPIMIEIYALINQMTEETTQQRPGYIFIMEGLISRFFSILENPSLYRKSHIKLSSKKEEVLLNKIVHILEGRHGRISREELETEMHYNSDYLNRIVKKYTGMTLLEYGLNFCLKEAERLLLNSDKSISKIMNELGFSNRSYFYRIFSKRYGLTPNEYRKKQNNI